MSLFIDMTKLKIYDLCKIRDALIMLAKYDCADLDMLFEVHEEIKKRGEK